MPPSGPHGITSTRHRPAVLFTARHPPGRSSRCLHGPKVPERFSFANLDEVLPLPDLIAIQRDSFRWFLDKGLAEAFADISPIEDFTGQLSLELEFDPTDPDLRPPPKFREEECKEKDMTYAAPVFVRARFMNAQTGEIKEQTVFMGDFPMMTDKGTFIINGTERVVVSQLVRSPGVIFQPGRDAKTIVTGTVHPYRGEWIEFDVEAKPSKDVTAGARVARKRRLSLFVLLRALGYEDEGFLNRFVRHFDFLEGQWEKERDLAPTREEALLEIYKRARPGEPLSAEAARGLLRERLLQPQALRPDPGGPVQAQPEARARDRADRQRPRHRPGAARRPTQGVLSPSEILATATYMLHLADGESGYRIDDQDHFANRRIRSVGELIQNQVRVGPVPHGAGGPGAHDDPGRRGHHAPDPDQHPPRGGRHQGVLRHQPAEPVHGPEQPAVGPGPQAPPVGPRARRPVA